MENRGENLGIGEGDVFFDNDRGSAHRTRMDVGMFALVFCEGRIFSWILSQRQSAMSAVCSLEA